jgi:hypothetical protein
MQTIGSILHGAYGDYYEQALCLKHYKRTHPGIRLVLFFASPHRHRELSVFDFSFADEVHPVDQIGRVSVDSFFQFQIQDEELQSEVLAGLSPALLAKFDRKTNLKPWTILRSLDFHDPELDIGLSEEGRARLGWCMEENRITDSLFQGGFTVGFLWRFRGEGSAISPRLQTSEEVILQTKRELFSELIACHGAHVLVCGMNVRTTDDNRHRIDAKYSPKHLGLDPERCTYLKGLSWGLELEIMRRCSLCLVMPSGFSEALWMKRRGATVLVDPAYHYLAKLYWNRMPIFDAMSVRNLWFQIRQPHTAARVLQHLRSRSLLPSSNSSAPSGLAVRDTDLAARRSG